MNNSQQEQQERIKRNNFLSDQRHKSKKKKNHELHVQGMFALEFICHDHLSETYFFLFCI
jgi:hypothetical protein